MVALAILLFVFCFSGCGKKEILVDTQWKTVSKITVSGEITGYGFDFDKLKLTAEAFPKPPVGNGMTSTVLRGLAVLDIYGDGGYDFGEYSFDLPMERQATKTYRTTNIFGKVVGKPIVRYETYKAEYQIIKPVLPAGWRANPAQYKVTKGTKNVDFEMSGAMED